jgi:hypothetical protein
MADAPFSAHRLSAIPNEIIARVAPLVSSLHVTCERRRVLRYSDSHNLPDTIRRWTEPNVGNVKRAIRTECHGRGEEES